MAGNREKSMEDLLKRLREESDGVEAAVLISSDAMPLVSDMPEDLEEELLSAMSSSLIASGEKVARSLERGDLEQVYLRCADGDLLVVSVNDDAVLACVVNNEAKMGITLLEVNRCARELSEII